MNVNNYFAVGRGSALVFCFDDTDPTDTLAAWERATACATKRQQVRVFRAPRSLPHLCSRTTIPTYDDALVNVHPKPSN
jgi:hypothetical protein